MTPFPTPPTSPSTVPSLGKSASSYERAREASPEAILADALRERLAVIADRNWYERDAAGHLQALMQVSERISSAALQLPPPVHPQLKHYLERCSYDKALAFLSGTPPKEISHAH